MSRYRKTFASLVGGVLSWAAVAWVPDQTVSPSEWYALAVVVATALGVYSVTNEPTIPAPPAPPVDPPAEV